jgi:UDP-N-acetylmuramoyl-tripeptide--D-alanyl-D-alanine ligase
MEPIDAGEILEATLGELEAGNRLDRLGPICTDSRTLRRGDFFVPLKGKRYDGHDFIGEAVEKGCSGIMYSRVLPTAIRERMVGRGILLVRVRDTLAGLQEVARRYRMRFQIPLVAVTGSNGKTTAKEMIGTVAGVRYTVLRNEGTQNNQFGVPLTLLKIDRRHSLAVLEMGMNARGEIRRLAEIAEPSVGLILNIGPAHLEFLGSLENVAAAKSELLEVMSRGGAQGKRIAVLNRDDPYTVRMRDRFALEVSTFGMSPESEVRGENVEQDGHGLRFTIRFRRSGSKVDVRMPVIGVHNMYNALAAAATCELLRIGPGEIAEGLSRVRLPSMRMEVSRKSGILVINDAYNANPESMRMALRTLEGLSVEGRRIFVAGDMLELGEEAVRAHEALGRMVAGRGVDILIAVGEHGARVAGAAREAGMPKGAITMCGNARQAGRVLRKIAKSGDCVLLKASRRVGLEAALEEMNRKSGVDRSQCRDE